ncbi:MAG TPA: ATP-binding protein [Gemmataceae bacterium]|nr:ATP-binding protein [Gemmataceae bacterium]
MRRGNDPATSTGKSHLVQAIGLAAIRGGSVVFYRSIFDTVRDFLHDEALAGQERVLQRYLKPDLLIIDDMGMKQLPKRSGEYLFEIILRRHEVKSTLMTSNRPLEDWGKLLGDVPSATAILDRFLHHAEIIQISGKSFRLANHPVGALVSFGTFFPDTARIDALKTELAAVRSGEFEVLDGPQAEEGTCLIQTRLVAIPFNSPGRRIDGSSLWVGENHGVCWFSWPSHSFYV